MPDRYSFGIEEEYFLVDAQTKSVARTMHDGFLQAAKDATGGRVTGEFLQSQIEVQTPPYIDMASAREDLRSCARRSQRSRPNMALRSSPPARIRPRTGAARNQSEGERYDTVMDDLQMIGQRNMLCGLHVHVELPNANERVDVMMRMLPYLPLFVALATSSPFWQSRQTGLMGYRLAAYDELPRTGVPELFRSQEEFDNYIEALVKAGVIENSSYIWWAIRPSLKHPTLELRAPDCCTRVEDTIALAALWRTLARRLYRNPWINWDMSVVSRAIVVENKWRAQRYGVHGTFVNIAGDGATPVAEMLDQLIEEITPDAESLGCLNEVRHCRAIVDAGTSADAQIALFKEKEQTGPPDVALRAVTDWLAEATLQ